MLLRRPPKSSENPARVLDSAGFLLSGWRPSSTENLADPLLSRFDYPVGSLLSDGTSVRLIFSRTRWWLRSWRQNAGSLGHENFTQSSRLHFRHATAAWLACERQPHRRLGLLRIGKKAYPSLRMPCCGRSDLAAMSAAARGRIHWQPRRRH